MHTALLVISTVCPLVLLLVLMLAFRQPKAAPKPTAHWTTIEYIAMLRRYRSLKRNYAAHGYVLAARNSDKTDLLLYILHEVRIRRLSDPDYLDRLLNLCDRILLEIPRVDYFDPKVDRQLSKIKAELRRHYEALLSGSARKIKASQKRIDKLSFWHH